VIEKLGAATVQFFSDQNSFEATQPKTTAGITGTPVVRIELSTQGQQSIVPPLTISMPTTIVAPPGQPFGKFGCKLKGSAVITATTQNGETLIYRPIQSSTAPYFFGIRADTSLITQIALSGPYQGMTVVVSDIETSPAAPTSPVAYFPLSEFERRIPGTQRFDFSAATIPINVWSMPIQSPLNSNTNDAYFKPGMVPPELEFSCQNNDPYSLRAFISSDGSFKGIAAPSSGIVLTIAFKQTPVQAAAFRFVELGGNTGNFIITVTGANGWTSQTPATTAALESGDIGVQALDTPIASISITREVQDASAFALYDVRWKPA
jgi:hypothetical protein